MIDARHQLQQNPISCGGFNFALNGFCLIIIAAFVAEWTRLKGNQPWFLCVFRVFNMKGKGRYSW